MKRLIAFGLAFVAAIVAVYAIRNDGRSGNEVVRLTRIDSVPESKPIGDNKTVFKASLSKATKVKRIASLEPSDESIRARLENPDSEKETYEATLPTIAIPVTPFDASEVDAIVVTMQPETGKQQPRLYWLREGETEPTKDAGTQFRFSFDGKSHTESIAVSQCPGWRGRIVALRLVPTDTATDVTVTAIDGIHFAPPSTGRAQVSVGAEVRDSIVTSSDSSTEVRVTAAAGSRLDFAVGVPDEAWNRDGGPVTFTVRVNGEERARRVVDPRANTGDRHWIEQSIEPLPAGSLAIQLGVAFSKEETCPRAAFGAPIVSAPVAGPARHVVLVSLDTLRADHVGCYGYDKPTSPRIDALALESVRFEDMIANAPETLESHMSLFTSLLPTAHGCYKSTHRLSPKIPTLAGTLSNAGFLTAGFVGNGFVASVFGFDEGFDRYDDGVMKEYAKVDTRQTFDSALEFLGKNADRDTFTFVHTYEIHTPYAPSPDYMKLFEDPAYDHKIPDFLKFYPDAVDIFGDADHPPRPEDVRHVIALYDAGIRKTDECVGRLVDGIAAKGLADSTLFVLLSDHGEEMMEHGTLANHGRSLYDELLRVPLIVRAPNLPRGQAVKGLVSHLDIAPTILEWLDVPSPREFTGRSLMDVMRGGARPNEYVISEDVTTFRRASLRRDATKYIRTRNVEADRYVKILAGYKRYQKKLLPMYTTSRGEEYYDLLADPREANDLAPMRQAACDGDLAIVNRILAANWAKRKVFGGSLHAESNSAGLKALGYLSDVDQPKKVEEEIDEEQREDIPRGKR